MQIVILEPLQVSEETMAQAARALLDAGHTLKSVDGRTMTNAEKIQQAQDAQVLVIANSPLSGEVIRGLPDLQMLSVAFTGVDHVDMAACRERGITVCNAQGYCTQTVAELALGQMISLLRHCVPLDSVTRAGNTKEGYPGRELAGRTVGIVGTGAIGRRVAELLAPFGCRLLGHDLFPSPLAAEAGIELCSLEELCRQSDIITLHVPGGEATRQMIGAQQLAWMKPTALLLNLSRGTVVDSGALAAALREGRLSGAAVDVFETEPPLSIGHPLLHTPNTIVTPHIAFASEESMRRRAEITMANISAWLAGAPQNLCG